MTCAKMDIVAVGEGFGLDAAIELVGISARVDTNIVKAGSERLFKLAARLLGQWAAAAFGAAEIALKVIASLKTILGVALEQRFCLRVEQSLHSLVADGAL